MVLRLYCLLVFFKKVGANKKHSLTWELPTRFGNYTSSEAEKDQCQEFEKKKKKDLWTCVFKFGKTLTKGQSTIHS